MASFEDKFRLKTNSERFADLFHEKIQKAAGQVENVYISMAKSGNSWIVEIVGEPFGGSSQYEAETIANMLMTCLSEESSVSISASYELDDYRGGDQASVKYTYPNENNNFQMSGVFGEYYDDDACDEDDEDFEDYGDDEASACSVMIEYAGQKAGWEKVNNTITKIDGAWD